MKLLKAGYFLDCFFGDGWHEHTRVSIKKTQHGPRIFFVSGIPLTKGRIISIGQLV